MSRTIRAPRGTELSCKGWVQEAAMRMLMNNLDPDVAERPEDLVVYGGIGRRPRIGRLTMGVSRAFKTSKTIKPSLYSRVSQLP